MPLTATMVLTTIADPTLLDGYYANFAARHHLEQIRVIVIPDRKTPGAAFERCAALRKKGLDVRCPKLQEQDGLLRRLGFPPDLVPYDSDNRRNIGYLMALEDNTDFLISIDDDNYSPADEDFFLAHAVVCESGLESQHVVETDGGWFNICALMGSKPPVPVYPRGFPYFARHRAQKISEARRPATVRLNAGLWLQEPDLDGITWLAAPVRNTSFRGRSVVLGERTWSPINTQNTALHRSAIPSYYFLRMGYPIAGIMIDRYGDIFSGYFSQACARRLGHSVRVGTPIATHARNSHNYLRDATQELACIHVLEDLLPWLTEQRLQGSTYAEAYCSLSHLLEEAVARFRGFIWTDETRQFFHATASTMREWLKACQRIEGGPPEGLPRATGAPLAETTARAGVPQIVESILRLQTNSRTVPRRPQPGDRIGFSLISRDRYSFTLQTIQSLDSERGFDLIWNDGSEEPGVPALSRNYQFKNLRLVERNYGVKGGPDAGIRFGLKRLLDLGYDYIGLIENDIVLKPGWLRTLMGLFDLAAAEGIAAGAASVRGYVSRVLEYRSGYSIDWASGAGLVLFSRPAARIILEEYDTLAATTTATKRYYAETFGVRLEVTEWEGWPEDPPAMLSPDWGFTPKLYQHGLATVGAIPSLAHDLEFDVRQFLRTDYVPPELNNSGLAHPRVA